MTGQYIRGRCTYGNFEIDIKNLHSNLTIGSFCSIGARVQFIVGGEHNTKNVSTYPFNRVFHECKDLEGHPLTKGDITIGNDVWIGLEAIILSGVTIGNGAVIGAGSIVTKDVADYEVVAGNPIQHIRSRFSTEEIKLLNKLKWWDWPIEKIIRAGPLLMNNDINALLNFHLKEESECQVK